jgi:hypothetical protein
MGSYLSRPMFPAFKEWHVIVEALGSGEQVLILRKGGIAEKRGEFDAVHASRFWLFPTQFHAQSDKTKPAAARFFPASHADETADTVTLRYFADITHHAFLTDWPAVAALDPHHYWTEAAIREKYDWSSPPGLHAFIVRVHRLSNPLTLSLTPAMSGCKSWIGVPYSPADYVSTPALDDTAFAQKIPSLI